MRKLLPALQFSEGRSKLWSGSKLINAMAELAEGDKADAFMVMVIPGLVQFSAINAQPVRGLHAMGGLLYAVFGPDLLRIASNGTAVTLGTVGGTLPVQMADNGEELAIQGGINNDQGYVYSGGVLYTAIPNLPQVSGVVYIDGYFVWPVFDSDQFVISGLNDGLSYDPLDVATVEGDPDNIVGAVNLQRELQFYGQNTMEPWWNTGEADFPFARQGNAFIERGTIDRNSLVKIDNSVHFVGDDLVVYRLNGYTPVRISTHAIEFRIANAAYFQAYAQTIEGHKLYILNTDVGTFCYDMATGAWHERKTLSRDRWRCSCATVCYGQTIFGDYFAGILYTQNFDEYTENGDPIPVEIMMPGIQTDRQKATLYSFELYCETGVGNPDDPDPQAFLSYSKDGGRTFSAQLPRSMGAVGNYLTRCIWRLGLSFRQLQIRLQLPSITKRYVISAFADIR